MDLFTAKADKLAPLADRMRPRTLDEFVGQRHIVGEGCLLRRAIQTDALTGAIFYGPPGTGKSTLAAIIANATGSHFERLDAVTAGVKDVRKIIQEAQSRLKMYGQYTYLLLDECHRWTRTQSDSLLPALEKGVLRLIGSTTENPILAMTAAIISRSRLFEFYPLEASDIRQVMERALADVERGLGAHHAAAQDTALDFIASQANGDARAALNALELAVLTTPPDEDGQVRITLAVAQESIQKRMAPVDDEQFYNMLSAFCKSLRGSDSDAALLWFARLMRAGVDPRIIARRLIAHASEDVGMANPNAMVQAVAAAQAVELIGLPEARLSLAQAILFICESPKSNAVVMAVDAALADAKDSMNAPVPYHLRDTSYAGATKLGSGEGYQYPHDFAGHYVVQQYLPDDKLDAQYYFPSDQGYEAKIAANQKQRKRRLKP